MLPRTWAGWLLVWLGFALLALLPLVATPFYVGLVTTAMIAAMLALSLQLLVGAAGLVNLGHGAFYGLAAYVVYLLSPEGSAKPIWLTLPLSMAAAGLAALVVGGLSLRTRGFSFLMVTLAFGQLVYVVFHDTKLGGGTDGAYLAKPLISAFGLALDPASLPRARRSWPAYYVALLQLMLMFGLLALLLRSMLGRVLEGIRINEGRMLALGFDTYRYKLAAFTISGALAGAAGHMWAMQAGFVNPELVGWHRSAEALLHILLGGIGTLAGPIVGAFAFTLLNEVAQQVTERKLLVEGAVILAGVLLLRNGITGLWSGRSMPGADDSREDDDRPSRSTDETVTTAQAGGSPTDVNGGRP
ncbi:MAG: branched-chain amino acid ABC transporter permease [Hyphomicrobiaceae bacterium]